MTLKRQLRIATRVRSATILLSSQSESVEKKREGGLLFLHYSGLMHDALHLHVIS